MATQPAKAWRSAGAAAARRNVVQPCKALLEDGPADSEQELHFEANFSMDLTNARMVAGDIVCQTCHWHL